MLILTTIRINIARELFTLQTLIPKAWTSSANNGRIWMARARMAMVSHLIHPLLFVLLSFFFFTNIFKMNYRFSLRTSDSTITKKMWCTLHKHTHTNPSTNTDNVELQIWKTSSNIHDIMNTIWMFQQKINSQSNLENVTQSAHNQAKTISHILFTKVYFSHSLNGFRVCFMN